MSQENVELVRAAYEAIARRDREALDADGLWELLDDIQDTVGYRPEVQEAVDLDEHVLIVLRMSGRGSRSGTLVSGRSFASKADALEAVGRWE